MTTKYQFDDDSHWQQTRLPNGDIQYTNELTGAMYMVKRDRFELLSAYLDGEVTASERKQVEEWLANDAVVQRLYARLLKLRQSIKSIPVPQSQATQATIQQVFARISRRSRLAFLSTGAAMAACAIGAVIGMLPTGQSRLPQLANQQIEQQPTSAPVSVASLKVAINNPVIAIPKAAQETPINQQPQRRERNVKNEVN